MFPRSLAALALVAIIGMPVFVDDAAAQTPLETAEVVAPALTGSVAAVQFTDEQSVGQAPRELRGTRRDWSTSLLIGLQAATIATQMLDVHSTMTAMKLGAVEANPMMGGLVQNKAAFIGVKAAMGAGLVYATHKLGKNNKVAAIVVSAAINSAYLFIANHNYKVARGLR